MSQESDLIRSFVEKWGEKSQGIGDDAAVLDVPAGEKLIVSTDAAVENVHFRRGSISSTQIGYRAAAAALSDLAAMAARPIGLLFALVLPADWRGDAAAIAEGVGEASAASNCPVVGGNISSGTELSITSTVLGSSPSPLARSGARPGDSLYVTGALGGAAAAVRAWTAGHDPDEAQTMRFGHPVPRIREAMWLAAHGATSAIDVSDGLTTDAAHLAEASRVTITIDADLVPRFSGASEEDALAGGEDYELLIAAAALDADVFRSEFNLPLTKIGAVENGNPAVRILRRGTEIAAPPGFDHLSHR